MEGHAVLIVAATAAEIAPVVATLGVGTATSARTCRHHHLGRTIDVLTTGVGMVPTSAWCSRLLATTRYDVALNFGVCGSFDSALAPGEVVHVVSDRLAELGAEDGDAFLPPGDLALAVEDAVLNEAPPRSAALARLPAVSGITVNTVHGNERTIVEIVRRFNPQVESMEGAAFMYACRIADVPFAQVRAVSNRVERRNRPAWKLAEAIARLGAVATDILADR